MIKVTLLGDSIRQIGYGNVVPELLGDGYEVFQPDDNCRFAKYTLRGLFDWAKDMQGSRIVHFNCGLWDICDIMDDGEHFTTLSEYTENMLRIADILLSRYEKVIFATSTPVKPSNPHNKNEVIEEYNNHIVEKFKERGIIINDLYSLVAQDIENNICEDTIHLSDRGVKLCAERVAEVIKAAAAELDDSAVRECKTVHKSTMGAPV